MSGQAGDEDLGWDAESMGAMLHVYSLERIEDIVSRSRRRFLECYEAPENGGKPAPVTPFTSTTTAPTQGFPGNVS